MSLAEVVEMPRARTAPAARFKRTCPECGEVFWTAYQSQDFCCEPHKKAWNNRRMTRGAVLFDLFMTLRNDRKLATALKVWKLLCRLAQAYRDEDIAQRGGRKSWRDATDVLAERPWLHADVIHTKTWKTPGGAR